MIRRRFKLVGPSLHLQGDFHFVTDAEQDVLAHPEIGTQQLRRGIGAADVAAQKKTEAALKVVNRQADRAGFAEQRQFALNRHQPIFLVLQGGGTVTQFWKLLDVEKTVAAQGFLQRVVAGVDRGRVDHDVNFAGLGATVENQCAPRGVEAAAMLRVAEMADFEHWKRMGRVNREPDRFGRRGGTEGGEQHNRKKSRSAGQ